MPRTAERVNCGLALERIPMDGGSFEFRLFRSIFGAYVCRTNAGRAPSTSYAPRSTHPGCPRRGSPSILHTSRWPGPIPHTRATSP
jgi:hypothetical protein